MDILDTRHRARKGKINGKSVLIKNKIRLYAFNGAKFDSYIVLK